MKSPIAKKLGGKGRGRSETIDIRIVPVINAVEKAILILNEETDVLVSGRPGDIEDFLARKREADIVIKKAGRDASDAGLVLVKGTAEFGATEKTLAELHQAALRNVESLQGAQNAIDHVSSLMKKVTSEAGSEGMYNRAARAVSSRDKTIQGFGAAI